MRTDPQNPKKTCSNNLKDALKISTGGCRQSCMENATNWDAYLRLTEEIKGLIFKFS